MRKSASPRSLSEYRIRSATPADAANIVTAFSKSSANLSAEDLNKRMAVFQDGVQIIVDAQNEKCVGFLLSEIWDFKRTRDCSDFTVRSDISSTHDYNGTELHISAVSIVDELKDTGMADFLMTTAINGLRMAYPRLRSVVAITHQGCRKSREFFAKRRFIAVDQISGFNGCAGHLLNNAIVMRKFFGLADVSMATTTLQVNLVHTDFALA